jgi:hypothetical protein
VQLILAAAVISAAILVAAVIASRSRRGQVAPRASADESRRLQLLALFAPGIAAVAENPRALLVWQPLATTARAMFPDDFAAIDSAAGATFPFSREQFEAAHARWSSEWLAWERAHDAECKLKTAAAEEELRASPASAVLRARLESVEREKLERYQRRYEEYTRVSKALKVLAEGGRPS